MRTARSILLIQPRGAEREWPALGVTDVATYTLAGAVDSYEAAVTLAGRLGFGGVVVQPDALAEMVAAGVGPEVDGAESAGAPGRTAPTTD